MADVQGSVRRKKKVVVREHGNDEKKIHSVLKKIGLSEIPSIDEVLHVLWNCVHQRWSTVNDAPLPSNRQHLSYGDCLLVGSSDL